MNITRWAGLLATALLLLAIAAYIFEASQPIRVQFLQAGVPVANARVDVIAGWDNQDTLTTDYQGYLEFPSRPRGTTVALHFKEGFSKPCETLIELERFRNYRSDLACRFSCLLCRPASTDGNPPASASAQAAKSTKQIQHANSENALATDLMISLRILSLRSPTLSLQLPLPLLPSLQILPLLLPAPLLQRLAPWSPDLRDSREL